MVRLSEILRRQEMDRVYFDEHKAPALYKLSSDSGTLSAENLYKELLGLLRRVFLDILNAKQIDLTSLKDKINLLSEFIAKDDGALLRLTEHYGDSEDYLVSHSVNVCILSLEIARGLNYTREAMLDLGIGAFLHDIGMLKISSILQHKRQLYTAEYEEVKNHVTYGVELLNNFGRLNDRVASIISQHHERRDGSGYLEGRSADQIDEYAQIVGLADVYEALIHSRPHRNRAVPFEYETIREIISNRDMFNPYILRVFLERLTRHPAYMLWLTTSGIYELLKQQGKISAESAIKPKIKSLGKRRYALFAAMLIVALLGIVILGSNTIMPNRGIVYPVGSVLSIAKNSQPLKLAYNFTDKMPHPYAAFLDLSGTNLEGYHFLSFLAKLEDKKTNKMRYANLKIAVENSASQRADYYVQGINNRWQEFRIPLSYFEAIKDWSSVASISFILQPWNIDAKQGLLYIDKIHFFRKK